jgi:hypothetical protein
MPRVLITKRFGYHQPEPATTWVITHNLDIGYPIVDVWIQDGTGPFINSDAHEVTITNTNTISIDFYGDPVKGHALIT